MCCLTAVCLCVSVLPFSLIFFLFCKAMIDSFFIFICNFLLYPNVDVDASVCCGELVCHKALPGQAGCTMLVQGRASVYKVIRVLMGHLG